MLLQEVRDTGGSGVSVRVRDGNFETVTHEEVIRETERVLSHARVPGRREKTPNYTSLACLVMSAAEINDPEGKYSHLSAVAHGSGFSVGGLGSRTPHPVEGFTHFTISLPVANAQQYLRMVSHVLNVVVERFISLTCVSAEHERWLPTYVSLHDRIVDAFQEMARH